MRLRDLLATAALGLAVVSAGAALAQVPPARGEIAQYTVLFAAAR